MPTVFHHIGKWYIRYERQISSLSLLAGFIFTSLTLTRVDMFIENFWVILHLTAAAIGIILLNFVENRIQKQKDDKNVHSLLKNQPLNENFPTKAHFWLTLIIQFGFGGTFSTFLVFYFRSATLSSSWPFLVLLAFTFIANEALKIHYTRISFQISVLFLAIYSFGIFFVPVLVHRIGDDIFVLSGFVSLTIILLFIFLLQRITKERFMKSRHILFRSITAIYIVVNILYFTNLIPPIPLSLKDAEVLHSIGRITNGQLASTYEKKSWTAFFKQYDLYHHVPHTPIYVYSAIFSPAQFNTDIVHVWQQYDETTKKWVTQNTVLLPISGGREDGFRTYSTKTNITPGKWRVDVQTPRGQKIGRIKFEVVDVDTEPELVRDVK